MQKNRLFKKSILASTLGAIILGLTACGGGSDGKDKGNNNIQMSGAVVDDFVAYSRVYVDLNNNGVFDSAYEPYAYTDASGFFTKSKNGLTNYCDLSPKEYNYRYCLEVDESVKNGGVIRVENGVDLLTTQVYEVAMSLVVNGTTEGLTITPLTSGNEAINNEKLIQAAVTKLNLTEAQIQEVQSNYAQYLNGYLNPSAINTATAKNNTKATLFNFNLNTYNPLDFDKNQVTEKDRGFKLAIQLHKIAESIAKELQPATTPAGQKKLARKDLMPAIYFSLIYELVANNPNNAANNDLFKSTAVITSIFTTAKKLLTERFGADYVFGTPTGDVDNLSALLNCVLSNDDDDIIGKGKGNNTAYNGDICENIRSYDDEDSRLAKLFAAELGTDVITEVTPDEHFIHALNQAQKVSQKEQTNQPEYDAKKNDFTTASAEIRAGRLAVAKTLDFPVEVFNTKYLDFSEGDGTGTGTGNDKIFSDFKPDGTIEICQSTNQPGIDLLQTGEWVQDPEKKHIINVSYLGLSIVLKNLDPDQDVCKEDFNGSETSSDAIPGTCLTYEYPDINNADERKIVLKTSLGAIGGGGSDDIAKLRPFSCNNLSNNQQ